MYSMLYHVGHFSEATPGLHSQQLIQSCVPSLVQLVSSIYDSRYSLMYTKVIYYI